MSWDTNSLWAKAATFFERAFNESKDDPLFGLWASLGLELLARSAIASVSPTLLAEPERDHRNLLHALGKGSERGQKKSISSAQVVDLCVTLFEKFTDSDKAATLALMNRRNEELHSGTCAFEEYSSSQWLAGFYRVCKILCECQGKTLEDLFNSEEAGNAETLLSENREQVKGTVESRIAAHRKVFENKSDLERENAVTEAIRIATELSWNERHRADCPACGSLGSIAGQAYGTEQVEHSDGEIIVRQPVSPRSFSCTACGLKLSGYAELEVVGMGGRHTRTSTYTPEDYYGLIDPDSLEPEMEYDNE